MRFITVFYFSEQFVIMCLHDVVQFEVFDVHNKEPVLVSMCRLCGKVLSLKPTDKRSLNNAKDLSFIHTHRP